MVDIMHKQTMSMSSNSKPRSSAQAIMFDDRSMAVTCAPYFYTSKRSTLCI